MPRCARLWTVVLSCVALASCGDRDEAGRADRDEGVVTTQDIADNAGALQGRVVTLERVPVASVMGPHAFWIELPNKNPYLVKLDEALVGSGMRVASGQVYTLTGQIRPMSDSVMQAWERSGALPDDGVKAEAQYATSFLEASSAQPAGGNTP